MPVSQDMEYTAEYSVKKKASEGSGKVHGISLATFLDRCLGKFSWHQGNVGLRQK